MMSSSVTVWLVDVFLIVLLAQTEVYDTEEGVSKQDRFHCRFGSQRLRFVDDRQLRPLKFHRSKTAML